MIFVDPRDGSCDLVQPLKKIGLPVDDGTYLDSGDLWFVGRGTDGIGLNIGIEYKHLSEMINSLRTNRLSGYQLHAMRAAEEGERPPYDVAYLLVEGELIYDDRGQLQRRASKQTFKPIGMSVSEMMKRLTVMHLLGGLNLLWAKNQRDSVQWINALYHTWTDKDLDEHKSHLALYEPPALVPLTKFERTVRTFPGIGLSFVKGAERKFTTIRRAANASIREWSAVESDGEKSRKLGQSKAERVVEHVS